MRKSLAIVLLAAAFLALAHTARAQEVTRIPDTSRQYVGLDAGLESAFVARATYARRVDLGVLRDNRLYARFTLPFVLPDAGDWGFDLGMQATAFAWRDLRLAFAAGPVVRNTQNNLFSATALGLGATMLAGYEGARWGLSAEAAYEQTITAYVRQSDLYRDTFYAGAKDGFYALSGSTARAGLRGGVRLGSVEIVLRGGYDWTGRLHATTPPLFATLGGAYAF